MSTRTPRTPPRVDRRPPERRRRRGPGGPRQRLLVVVVLTVLAVLAAGCGDDGDGATASSTAPGGTAPAGTAVQLVTHDSFNVSEDVLADFTEATGIEVEILRGGDALDRLLSISHYLVVTVPRTKETEGMIGARELARLPAGAVVINVSRGDVVDEDALVDALRAGRLRGAGLDVFREEPLRSESPLWTLPNTLLLPHVSGTSHGFWRRETDLVVDNVRRYLAGESLLNTVDKQAGY